MSFVTAVPELIDSAAVDLATIGTNLSAAHAAAATSTTQVLAAAGDEVSTAIAAVFSSHARAYQGLAGQAVAFQDHFVATVKTGAGSYVGAEAAAAASLNSPAAPAATFANLLSQLAANPMLIPEILLVLGVIAYIVIAVLVLNLLQPLWPWLGALGVLGA